MAAFYLKNREAKRVLNVYNNGNLLPPCLVPTCLGVKLDRSLTFRHYPKALRKKLSTRVSLLRRHARSGYGVVSRHCASQLFSWSIPQLSTVHQFGVVVRRLGVTLFIVVSMIPNKYCTDSWLGSRMHTWGDLDQDSHWYLLRGNY